MDSLKLELMELKKIRRCHSKKAKLPVEEEG